MNARTTAALAGAASLGVTLAAGPPLIAYLHRLRYGQTAYEDAPKTHAVKTGTPTMGGLLFGTAFAAGLALRPGDRTMLALAVAGLGCGAVGFVDDYAKVVRMRNKGLGARDKFVLTAAVAAAFLALALPELPPERRGVVLVLGERRVRLPLAVAVPLVVLAFLGTTHAVNLTDGLDGLAGGTIVPPLVVFTALALAPSRRETPAGASVATLDAALLGAVLGFLRFNRHPARVFMGDTGALALGGTLAASAVLTENVLLLPLVGGVFAAEALSVILQVASFKRTGKRIFRMSPLHHHFELGGWAETKVTARFWTASTVLSLVGAAVAR